MNNILAVRKWLKLINNNINSWDKFHICSTFVSELRITFKLTSS